MDEDPELSDLILRALVARRRKMQGSEAARSIEILGSTMSAAALALRTYVARQQLPHMWVEVETVAGAALARAVTATPSDLPVVITPTGVLRGATPGQLADQLGLSYRQVAGQVLDLVVVGAGPAGLAAAVYGASEGLQATENEDEAQELLRRQVERTLHGARAVVLARNNSADRLEPTTSLVELDVLRAAP
jgi:thioredoxin reductase (NADPH)